MNKYQDTIKSLPTDNEPIENKYLVDTIFQEDPTVVSKLASEFKESLLIVLLFVLFSSQQLDEIIKKYVPLTQKSPFALVGVKCTLILFLYYVIKNFQLIRK